MESTTSRAAPHDNGQPCPYCDLSGGHATDCPNDDARRECLLCGAEVSAGATTDDCGGVHVDGYEHDDELPQAPDHTRDEDCDVDPADGLCRVCGVGHGEPCPDCGGRAFHRDGCPRYDL